MDEQILFKEIRIDEERLKEALDFNELEYNKETGEIIKEVNDEYREMPVIKGSERLLENFIAMEVKNKKQ